jgi:hypothetical protein
MIPDNGEYGSSQMTSARVSRSRSGVPIAVGNAVIEESECEFYLIHQVLKLLT